MAGRIITIAQQKGGSGKTTLTAHLAVACALNGLSVALLDVDPQGSLGSWFEAREARLGEAGTGLSFRTASGWGARREARAFARDHDVIFVDTPPKSDIEAGPAIDVADLVVIPIQPTPVDLWATQATLALAAKEGASALMVLNRVPPRSASAESVTQAIRELGPLADTRLFNRVAYGQSMGSGGTVQEVAPGSKGAAEVEALGLEVLRHGAARAG